MHSVLFPQTGLEVYGHLEYFVALNIKLYQLSRKANLYRIQS